MVLKQVTLWSFLTQSSAKREVVCPDDLQVNIEEFAQDLKTRLKANRLPAEAELVIVNWDDTNTTQRYILIRYTGTQAATNVLQYAVGLEQLGNFAYLEKKVYLLPPQLPQRIQTRTPRKVLALQPRKPIDGCGLTGLLLLAGSMYLIGTIGTFMQLLSGSSYDLLVAIVLLPLTFGFLFWGYKRIMQIRIENKNIDEQNSRSIQENSEIVSHNIKIEEWNRNKVEIDRLWTRTFDQWHKETLEVAYLAQTTDVFGRWTSAISTTIDQVVQRLFIDRDAQAQKWDEEQKSKAQLEQVLKDRYNEVF